MQATFTTEQEDLARTAGELGAGGVAAARAMLGGGAAPDEPTRTLFEGFAGLGVPIDLGGDGGGLVDVAVLLHGLGRTLTPTPYVAHVLALQAVLGAGRPTGALASEFAAAAAGQRRWALAVHEGPDTGWGPWSTAATADRVSGSKPAVPDGAAAERAVVTLSDGRVALAAPAETRPCPVADPSRPAAELVFAATPAVVAGPAQQGLLRAAAVLSAELVGVGRGAIALAADYARARTQFGQPIGRFQGVAHQLADALTAVETAWSLTLYACWAIEAAAPDAARAVHAAKACAGDAAVFAAERALQTHGGIGMTWEADPHLFLRRALAGAAWLGTSAWHRQQLGAAVLAR